MHGLIFADIEGIAGIWDLNDTDRCKDLYTKEIQVYIDALIENGVEKITVCDAHDEGDMILDSVVSKNVRLISNSKNLSFVGEQYDFALLVGLHGMEGSTTIRAVHLNFIKSLTKGSFFRKSKNCLCIST